MGRNHRGSGKFKTLGYQKNEGFDLRRRPTLVGSNPKILWTWPGRTQKLFEAPWAAVPWINSRVDNSIQWRRREREWERREGRGGGPLPNLPAPSHHNLCSSSVGH
eukprot:246856-Pelagomonas_calceolata.AAC.6